MSDDAADYSGTSDSDSESDKVPSRLPARAESCILAHDPSLRVSVLHAGFGCAPSSPEWTSIGVCDAIFCDPSTSCHGTKDHPVWASVPIATDPNMYDLSVLLALNPIKVYESIISSGIAGQNMVACPGLPSLSWAATRRTQPRRVAIRLRSLSCRTSSCRLPWVTTSSR